MKTLYLDCSMGAAGDMLTGALLELLPEGSEFLEQLNGLGLPGVVFRREAATKCGILGTHISVTVNGAEETSADVPLDHQHHWHDHAHGGEEHHHDHVHGGEGHHHDHVHGEEEHHHDHVHSGEGHHSHASLSDVTAIVAALPVSQGVKENVTAVYRRIAEAESHAHGRPVSEIHFHEVGTMDAIADVTAVCLLMERLAPEQVVVSPVHVGSGQVRCAHGILPVPAPATAYLLKNVPMYGGSIAGELCTPTGAALLTQFATRFGAMPVMRTAVIGYGMGSKEFAAANCVRAFLGETEEEAETICQLHCNLDDMTGEAIGFAMERLFEGGALDVYTQPIGMKKSRPGVMLSVMCSLDKRDEMRTLLFRHTTTLGVREQLNQRCTLRRTTTALDTPLGQVRQKKAQGCGIVRTKYEFEDIAALARTHHTSLEEILEILRSQDTKKNK